MKTLLFDIDGTLIVTNDTGTQALETVLQSTFGVKRPCMDVAFGGRTDFSLINEVLLLNDITPNEANFLAFTKAYRNLLPQTLSECGGEILPGVVELLSRLAKCAEIRCDVMTGNLRDTATQKLDHFGLTHYFDNIFGGDFDADRRHLARRTALFLRGSHGHEVKDGTIVIGDTPADITCGLDIGASVLAVCTGQFNRDSLEAAGANAVHEDLSDVDTVFRWLTE
ncbi:HAD family hydrolase [bacterium]|nr:HAD family hydrolase [bacterium]